MLLAHSVLLGDAARLQFITASGVECIFTIFMLFLVVNLLLHLVLNILLHLVFNLLLHLVCNLQLHLVWGSVDVFRTKRSGHTRIVKREA